MPVPASINDLSTTPASNSPAGTETAILTDDYLRFQAACIATLRDSQASLATLAASTGSSLVGHIASGVGAVARTLQSKDRDRVSVFDFMTTAQIADVVAGTRSIDVTAAVQAALDAWSGVEFPPGGYRTSAALLFNDNNFVIGSGRGTQFYPQHNGACFAGKAVTPAAGTNVRRFSGGGRDFMIYGPGTASANSIALDMRGCTMFKFYNVLIQNIATGVRQGNGYSTYYNEYFGCDLSTVTNGYVNDTLGNENKVWGGRINSCTTGTTDNDCSGNRYFGVAIEVFGTGHLTSNTAAATNISYVCSRLENAPTSGIGIDIRAIAQSISYLLPQFTGLTTNVTDISTSGSDGVANNAWVIGSGTAIKKHQRVTAVIDFPNILAGTTNDQLVAITGALTTDSVFITAPAAIGANLIAMAIPAAGGVYVRLANVSAAAIDPPSLTFTIDIWRH